MLKFDTQVHYGPRN